MPVVDGSHPYGSPEPVQESPGLLSALGTVALVVGSVLLVVVACPMMVCPGATRSARLQWEERQTAIDQAIAQQDTSRAEEPTHLRPFRATADKSQHDMQP